MNHHEFFYKHFLTLPAWMVRAPGRVNLLGEHVDYNDGPVLPAAIDRAVYFAAGSGKDDLASLYALDYNANVTFRLADLDRKVTVEGKPLPDWALYPAGVAWALQKAGYEPRGINAVFSSDVPIGAGLSSSAAVEVGFAVLWQTASGWNMNRLTLAQICQRAENDYVGVNCGLMDQFASANGVAGHALYFDTRSLEWEPVPLPPNTVLVIADSGIRRSLTTSAYNERRAACEAAVAELQRFKPGLRSLRDIETTEFAAFSVYLPETIRQRAEHVVKEIARVESARSALHRTDTQAFGALMYAGHTSLKNLYEVSTPELDILVHLTRSLPGAIGARLTGAGFGGCTVNLVWASDAEAFMEGLREGYRQKTGREAQVYLCRASAGANAETL